MTPKKKRWRWLVLSVLLVGLAAMLLRTEATAVRTQDRIAFPTHMRPEELERLKKRSKQLVLRVKGSTEQKTQVQELDPLMVALSGAADRGFYMVFELRDLMTTPIGEIVIGCLEQAENNPLEQFEEETGMSPIADIQRVAFAKDLVLIEGNFNSNDRSVMTKNYQSRGEGDAVRYTPSDTSKKREPRMALWRDSLLLISQDDSSLDESLGLLGGAIPYDPEALPATEAFGAIYGQIEPTDIADIFQSEEKAFADRFAEMVETVSVHIDADSDVAMSASVQGWEADPTSDLAKSLGGIISLARLKARTDRDDELAALLDFATINPNSMGFNLEVALPLSFLEEHLGDCQWIKGDKHRNQSDRDGGDRLAD